jgi:hypothetical protein
MLNKSDIIKLLNQSIIRKSYPELEKGGQHCGVPRGVSLYCPEIDLEIRINTFRSQHRNVELANTLIQLAIEEYVSKSNG